MWIFCSHAYNRIVILLKDNKGTVPMIWQQCLQNLKSKLSEAVFQMYFANLDCVEESPSKVVVEAPHEVDVQLINRSYKGLFELAYQEETGRNVEIEIRHPRKSHSEPAQPSFTAFPGIALSDEYRFTNFVVGKNSQFAYSAAYAVAQAPGKTKFNPLLIYGGSGLGKTHLIQAIGNFVKQQNHEKHVRYITSDDFMREYVESLKNDRISELSMFYRNKVDLLLMDDLQFLSGRNETQNEFFHIFNALHQAGKQIVLTSDHPPSEVKGLEERLISRFQWGLCVDIQPPDVETREAILRKKADALKLDDISDDVIKFLASSIDGNVRLLEGAVRKLLLQASIRNSEIDIEMAREIVVSLGTTIRKRINLDDIISVVAEYFSVDDDKILEGGRGTKEVAQARQVAMFLMKELSNLSLKSVGRRFGDRDHSTVVHAIKTVQKLMESDTTFKRTIESLKHKIQV
jgi:chromosomal replication initiator protein